MHTHRYCELIRNREAGDHSEAELRERFTKLDEDGSGKVDMSEYLQWSLRDALTRSSDRVVDLFRAWDEDRSGAVDKKEFRKAIRAMGFDIPQRECDAVFDSLDEDKSGSLEYKELNAMLRKGVGSDATKANLKRAPTQKDTSRGAKLTAKNTNQNYVTARSSVLPTMTKLTARSGTSMHMHMHMHTCMHVLARTCTRPHMHAHAHTCRAGTGVHMHTHAHTCRAGVSVQEQLRKILTDNQIKLIDLFREWDDDGNGALDKFEFRKAVAAMGFDAPKAAVDALFNSFDEDRSGWVTCMCIPHVHRTCTCHMSHGVHMLHISHVQARMPHVHVVHATCAYYMHINSCKEDRCRWVDYACRYACSICM